MQTPQSNRLWVALVAALLLALQTAAGAYALGTGATTEPLDAFGNPLCITSGMHAGAEQPSLPAHSTLPGCCTLACGLAAATLGPAPAAVASIAPPHAALLVPPGPVRTMAVRQPEHSPGNPRAPPLS